MSAEELKPCPFCGQSDRAQHLPTCWFLLRDIGASRARLAEAWNHRAATAAGTEKDAELADVLNTTLWLYRRLPHAYGNPPFVDKAILTMADRLGLDDVPAAIKERAVIEAHSKAGKDGT